MPERVINPPDGPRLFQWSSRGPAFAATRTPGACATLLLHGPKINCRTGAPDHALELSAQLIRGRDQDRNPAPPHRGRQPFSSVPGGSLRGHTSGIAQRRLAASLSSGFAAVNVGPVVATAQPLRPLQPTTRTLPLGELVTARLAIAEVRASTRRLPDRTQRLRVGRGRCGRNPRTRACASAWARRRTGLCPEI
jgi:hypothetical protein